MSTDEQTPSLYPFLSLSCPPHLQSKGRMPHVSCELSQVPFSYSITGSQRSVRPWVFQNGWDGMGWDGWDGMVVMGCFWVASGGLLTCTRMSGRCSSQGTLLKPPFPIR